jgi:dTDP-4-amino-4,6-dideoxygalactose transaminase
LGKLGSDPNFHPGKAFDGTGWRPSKRLPAARELGEMSILFLVHPTLTEAEVDKTCEVVRRVMGVAGV